MITLLLCAAITIMFAVGLILIQTERRALRLVDKVISDVTSKILVKAVEVEGERQFVTLSEKPAAPFRTAARTPFRRIGMFGIALCLTSLSLMVAAMPWNNSVAIVLSLFAMGTGLLFTIVTGRSLSRQSPVVLKVASHSHCIAQTARCRLQPGDEVLAISSRRVAAMDATEVATLLDTRDERPLALIVCRSETGSIEEDQL